MKNYKVTIFAVIALVVALAGYYIFIGILGEAPDNNDDTGVKRERVAVFHPDNVVKIETHYKEDFTIERKEDKWVCTSHSEVKIDENSMITLLNSLANMQGNVVIDEGEEVNYDNFGFVDNPDYISLFMKDGTVMKILVGNTNLSGSELYCMFEDGSKIYAISSSYSNRLRVTRGTITSSRIFNAINEERINTIELKRNGTTKFIIKGDFSGDEKGWNLSYPVKIKGNVENVNSLVSTLKGLLLGDLVSANVEDLSQYGLDVPTAQYLVTDNNITKSFEIGAKTPDGQNRYCTVDGTNHVYLMAISKLSFVDNDTTTYVHTYSFLESQEVLSHVEVNLQGKIYKLDYEVTATDENYWFNSTNVNMPGKDLRSEFKKITTAMYSLKLEVIDAEIKDQGDKICSIEYTRIDGSKVLVEFFERDATTAYIMVDGEYMNGFLYTRRITGDTSDSLKTVIENFENLIKE